MLLCPHLLTLCILGVYCPVIFLVALGCWAAGPGFVTRFGECVAPLVGSVFFPIHFVEHTAMYMQRRFAQKQHGRQRIHERQRRKETSVFYENLWNYKMKNAF